MKTDVLRKTSQMTVLSIATLGIVVGLLLMTGDMGCRSSRDPVAALGANGFTPDAKLETLCKSPCKGYVNDSIETSALVYEDRTFVMRMAFGRGDKARETEIVRKVLTALYPSDVVAAVTKNYHLVDGKITIHTVKDTVGSYVWKIDLESHQLDQLSVYYIAIWPK